MPSFSNVCRGGTCWLLFLQNPRTRSFAQSPVQTKLANSDPLGPRGGSLDQTSFGCVWASTMRRPLPDDAPCLVGAGLWPGSFSTANWDLPGSKSCRVGNMSSGTTRFLLAGAQWIPVTTIDICPVWFPLDTDVYLQGSGCPNREGPFLLAFL